MTATRPSARRQEPDSRRTGFGESARVRWPERNPSRQRRPSPPRRSPKRASPYLGYRTGRWKKRLTATFASKVDVGGMFVETDCFGYRTGTQTSVPRWRFKVELLSRLKRL